MSPSQMQMKRLRKKNVSVAEMDMNTLKPRMIDHLCVSKPSLFRGPAPERLSNGEAEFVEDRSVVMRSGTVQHSKDHPMFDEGFGPQKTVYLSGLEPSETFSLPNRPSKDTNLFYKKAMRNYSELAEPRRLPTVCFGLIREQQTESHTAQVVDSYPKVEYCGAKRHNRQSASWTLLLKSVELWRHKRRYPKVSCLQSGNETWLWRSHIHSNSLWHWWCHPSALAGAYILTKQILIQ